MSWAAARPAQSWRAISVALSPGRRPMRRSERREVLAVHVLHGEEGLAVHLADVVDAADRGWVTSRAVRASLWKRSSQSPVLWRRGGEELERDGLAEGQVVGAVDLAHAALPQEADDAIALEEEIAGREPFVRGGTGTGAPGPGQARGRTARGPAARGGAVVRTRARRPRRGTGRGAVPVIESTRPSSACPQRGQDSWLSDTVSEHVGQRTCAGMGVSVDHKHYR